MQHLGKHLQRLAIAAAMAAGTLAAHAQDSTLPAHATQAHAAVVTGGVGTDEDAAMKRMAREYPLRVLISGRGGDYYVAQDFRLVKDGEVVFDLPSAGPWVLIDVPPGRYAIEGVFDGQTLRRAFTLPAAGTTVHWVLPPNLD